MGTLIGLKINIFILIFLILSMQKISAQEINISDLTIEEKIRQMIIIPVEFYYGLDVGGIFFSTKNKFDSPEEYNEIIRKLQNRSKIKLFVTADLEGYWNPFEKFYESKTFGGILNGSEAFMLGKEHGELLASMGFNLDFSPIVETRNTVWLGRSFSGNAQEEKANIDCYSKGLHECEFLTTAKN